MQAFLCAVLLLSVTTSYGQFTEKVIRTKLDSTLRKGKSKGTELIGSEKTKVASSMGTLSSDLSAKRNAIKNLKDSLSSRKVNHVNLDNQTVPQIAVEDSLFTKKKAQLLSQLRGNLSIPPAPNADSLTDKILRQGHDKISNAKNDLASSLSLSNPRNRFDSIRSVAKTTMDSFNLKKFAKSVKKSIKPSGTVELESFATNYLDPFTPGDKVYTRLYANPQLYLGPVPLRANVFLTTERNTYYNANAVNLSLDVDQLIQDRRDKFSQQLQDQINIQELSERKGIELDQFNRDVQRQIIKKDQVEAKLRSQLSEKKVQLENAIQRELEEIESKKDSLSTGSLPPEGLKSQYQEILKIENELKTIEKSKKQLLDMKQKLDSTQQWLKNVNANANGELEGKHKELVANKGRVKAIAEGRLGRLSAGLINHTEQLDIGITYPFVSELTLGGIPVKGLNYAFDNEKLFFHVAAGKTYRDDISLVGLNHERPDFERNIGALKFGAGSQAGNNIYVISLKSRDEVSAAYSPKDNWVNGIGFQIVPAKKMVASAEYLNSYYLDHFPGTEFEVQNTLGLESLPWTELFWNNSAFNAKVDYQFHKNWKFSSKWKQINPGYRSLGSPYLMRNFAEYDLRTKGRLWKNKIQLSTFFKELRSNPTGLEENTLVTKGYGFNAHFNSPGWPTFIVTHNPYTQGNNNPDTLFRTNNQLSNSSLSAIYNVKGKESNINLVANYTRSVVEYFQLENQRINTAFLTGSINMQWKKGMTALHLLNSRTTPGVDTVNFTSYRFEACYTGKKGVTFGTNLLYMQYQNGAYRRTADINAQLQFGSSLRCIITIQNGSIYKLYGVGQKDIYSGRIRLVWAL